MKIISIATWHKRFESINKFLNQFTPDFYNTYHVILNMSADDYSIFPKNVYDTYKDKIEFNVTDINYGSINKLLPMIKYKEHPIMIMDDDMYYNEDVINEIWASYEDDCIVGTWSVIVNSKQPKEIYYTPSSSLLFHHDDYVTPQYKKSAYKYNLINQKRKDILFLGAGTVLFPPNILKLDEIDYDKEFKFYTQSDDEFIFKRSLELNVYKKIAPVTKRIFLKALTSKGALCIDFKGYYEKQKIIWSEIYKHCKDFENDNNLCFERLKFLKPTTSLRSEQQYQPYNIYKSLCDYFGFEDIWKPILDQKNKKKNSSNK